ncbi:hypothetical protein Tco_0891764 [Tanacetum coccineum]|uniref:HMA domain-containing protein n=1 Tax=Tanacetum coccineum TaxID=301880 RepID=A0ABQ5C6T0_9ASTR
MSGISCSTIKVNGIYNLEKVLKVLDRVYGHKSVECTSVLHQPDGVRLQGAPWLLQEAQWRCGRLRYDAVTKSPTSSLERSRRRRFIPVTPSPRSVNNILHEFGVGYAIMNRLRRHKDWTCVEMSKWPVMEARGLTAKGRNSKSSFLVIVWFMLLVLVFLAVIQDDEKVACDGGCCSKKKTWSIA